MQPSRREEFEIALICALPLEYNAVSLLFDEFWDEDGDPFGKAAGDPNNYTTGRIGKYNVVLALLPLMGKANAASAAANIRFSYTGVRLALLVGICGGVPRKGQDDDDELLLGDVAISKTIVQYDFGRRYPDKFIQKDTVEDNLGRPSKDIRSLLAALETDIGLERLQQRTAHHLKELQVNATRRKGRAKYNYPGTAEDKLFKPSYRHKHHGTPACICKHCNEKSDSVCEVALNSSCADLQCNETYLMPRERLNTKRQLEQNDGNDVQEPAIHIGRIASGDTVMKSGEDRDSIAKQDGVIAFEMEGAGVWDEVPCVVIKGVCDYADCHKNKRWQDFAAATAAAAMKALLERYIQADKFPAPAIPDARQTWRGVVREDSSAPTRKRIRLDSPVQLTCPESTKTTCLQSLSFPNIDSRRHNIAFAHQNTCDWLFKTAQFQRWQNRDDLESYNGVLWIKGKPGAGKSTLMKHALLHYQQSFPNHAIAAYFFNARGDTLEKSPLGMFRSLLYQLLEQNPQSCNRFIPLFLDKQKKHGIHWTWYSGELKGFLLEMIRHQSQPTVLFVDALDECNESQVRDVASFLETLSSTTIGSETSLKICLSSRHYPTITMAKMLELVVENRAEHGRDIAIYVQDKLKMRNKHIESELLRKAAGVFMWIILVTEMLNQAFDEGRITAMRRKLREVPGDLDEVFRTLLEKNNLYKHETILMLQWVLFAEHPVKPEELYFAVLAGTEPENLGPWDQSKVTDQTIERFITTTSRGLIEICKRYTKTVQFIHESVNDFLVRNKRLQTLDITLAPHVMGASHDRLVVCCMSYIEMAVLEPLVKDRAAKEELARNYPFLEYASTHILHHAEQAHVGCITQHELFQRLQHEPKLFKRLKNFHDIFKFKENEKYGMETKLLYVMSLHHCQGLTQTILRERSVDFNAQGGYFGNPLQAAASYYRHSPRDDGVAPKEFIQMLLDAGADVNSQGGYYGNALQAAAAAATFAGLFLLPLTSPVKDVVQMLLDAGADVNAQGGYFGNALQAAAAAAGAAGIYEFTDSAKDVVQMLLDAGADVNAQGGYYGNALQAAATSVAAGVVQMLLDAGADVNAQGGYYGNALQAAVGGGCEADMYCFTHRAKDVVQMLLDAGADVNAQGGYYGNALQAAAAATATAYDAVHNKIVKMLLDAGADVNAQGGYYGNALQAAASYYRHSPRDDGVAPKELIQMLLDAGADVNAQGGYYGNALQAAAAASYDDGGVAPREIIKMLLDAGADVNAQGGYYGNALQAAAAATPYDDGGVGPKEIIKMLLDAGADVNPQGGYYGNALQAAAAATSYDDGGVASKEIIKMLLDAGADVNAQGGYYGNALQAALAAAAAADLLCRAIPSAKLAKTAYE